MVGNKGLRRLFPIEIRSPALLRAHITGEPIVGVEFVDIVMVAVAAILGALAIKLLDKLRGRDAATEARDIVERAERDAANRLKEAELEIKERSIQQKAEGEK